MTDTTYNGWKNYETWNAKLWMDNEDTRWSDRAQELLDETTGDTVEERRDFASGELAREMESEHDEFKPEVAGVYADLLNAALAEIDWVQIADAYLEDVTPSDAE